MADIQLTINSEMIQDLFQQRDGVGKLLQSMLNQVLEAEMSEFVGAQPYERNDERVAVRNGYYERQLTTRVGKLTLRVPRDRSGRFSTEIFERYQRHEQALVTTLMEMVVNGVSTRKVTRITEELCGTEFSKSTVSKLCAGLDEHVEAFNERPLEKTYPCVLIDAIQTKVRRQEAVRATAILVVVGITEDGYREILGIRPSLNETEQGWLDTFRWLRKRGLRGVEVMVSDAHEGLVNALHESFNGVIWQRCQVHFRKNVIDKTPKKYRDQMHENLSAIFTAPTPGHAKELLTVLYTQFEGKADDALDCLEEGFEDSTAVLGLPKKYRTRLRTTNMVERLNEEIRRREKVIRIFPNIASAKRLIGAVLMEQNEVWMTRRYLIMDDFQDWQAMNKQAEEAACFEAAAAAAAE